MQESSRAHMCFFFCRCKAASYIQPRKNYIKNSLHSGITLVEVNEINQPMWGCHLKIHPHLWHFSVTTGHPLPFCSDAFTVLCGETDPQHHSQATLRSTMQTSRGLCMCVRSLVITRDQGLHKLAAFKTARHMWAGFRLKQRGGGIWIQPFPSFRT